MIFPPEHYFETATERMEQALYLHEQGTSYAVAIYVGGVAVECLLRAFKARRNPLFDERHDLLKLFSASGMLRINREILNAKGWSDVVIDKHLESLRLAVNDVDRIWDNSYRFVSERRLRTHLKKLSAYRRIKGDPLKEVSRQFLIAAQTFLNLGVTQWRV